jgi:hypothetical protein
MSGQPKKRALIEELERRTREEFGLSGSETHADYALLWLENGGTILTLAESISGAKGIQIMRASLDKYIRSLDPEWEPKSRRARAHGSFTRVEQAELIAETKTDKDDVPYAKLRVDTKLKVAAMFNREEFGERKGTNITLNLGTLHIDAMRRRALPSATATAIDEVAEVLTIEESTS